MTSTDNNDSTREIYGGCIGIDLGTTNSCVACWIDDGVKVFENSLGDKTTPSWISFTSDGEVVGKEAKRRQHRNLRNTLFDIKRIIGCRFNEPGVQDDIENFPFDVISDSNNNPILMVQDPKDKDGERQIKFRPEEISAKILREMRKTAEINLGKRVTKAVVTVPAYFNDSQRASTRNACLIAGMECLRIINEPTAACLCYGLNKMDTGSRVIIVDIGGGTGDISVLKLNNGIFEVVATGGDTHLGGEDFDWLIADYLEQLFRKSTGFEGKLSNKSRKKLKGEAERAKVALSQSESVQIDIENLEGEDFECSLSRVVMNRIIQPLLDKLMKILENVLHDAKLKPLDIDEIVLVGGSTRIPRMREMLSNHFGGKRLNHEVNPDEAVAYGASIQGAILTDSDQSGKTDEMLLMDIIPLSLGIETKGGAMNIVIDKNTPIPVSQTKVFTTVEDNQYSVKIKVYEGERTLVRDNHKLGDFELCDLPAVPRGMAKIEVTFEVNQDGLLFVSAMDINSGKMNSVRITDDSRLTPEQVANMIQEAEENMAEDQMRRETVTVRNSVEKYLDDLGKLVNDPELNKGIDEEEISFVNQYIMNVLDWLATGDHLEADQIQTARDEFNDKTKPIVDKIFNRKKMQDNIKRKDNDEITAENNSELVNNLIETLGT